jgi:hypothetical protein
MSESKPTTGCRRARDVGYQGTRHVTGEWVDVRAGSIWRERAANDYGVVLELLNVGATFGGVQSEAGIRIHVPHKDMRYFDTC